MSIPPDGARIPIALKLAYTGFMAILIPSYWLAYGPTNFLYFCDVALFVTLLAVWLESPLLVGAAAVGILFPQVLWVTDFLARCLGLPLTDMTAYMFDPNLAVFYRGLSLFHGWLPFLLLYLVWKLGYDRRSLILWTGIAETLMLICYFFIPEPGRLERIAGTTNPPVNINLARAIALRKPGCCRKRGSRY